MNELAAECGNCFFCCFFLLNSYPAKSYNNNQHRSAMLKKTMRALSVTLMTVIFAAAVSLAATTATGNGSQSRGYPGQNAKINGQLFSLPATGTITSVNGQGASGFWIEKGTGELVMNFNSNGEARGFTLPAGSYRVIPNLQDGAASAWINVVFTCP